MNPDGKDYEDHKANLEAAALDITEQVFEFWSQNDGTDVEFDIDTQKRLHVRVKGRQKVTVPFSKCSKGFTWFFSFLAKFNRIAQGDRRLVLLLDEPGLNLHATAQGDLLRLIDERLVTEGHQVIYSTHSPFMVPPEKLSRVRTVEDREKEGTVVSADCLVTDKQTAFPLQAALGYSLAQTLFVGPKTLLVEGPSDLLYLQAMSAHLGSVGRATLDFDSWVVTPVGGSGKLAAFVTLLGSNKLKVAVLMDFAPRDQQIINNILKLKVINSKRIIRPTEFTGTGEADTEDMFDAPTYIELVKTAYPAASKLSAASLPPGNTLVKRVEAALSALGISKFNHYLPSRHLEAHLAAKGVPDEVMDRFEGLFKRIKGLK